MNKKAIQWLISKSIDNVMALTVNDDENLIARDRLSRPSPN
jgi:hypothetical protein